MMEDVVIAFADMQILFGSEFPLITPERWMADFEEAGFKGAPGRAARVSASRGRAGARSPAHRPAP